VFVENPNGMLSGIDIVSYSIHQPLKVCWNQVQIPGAYIMVQHGGLNVVPWLKLLPNVNHFIYVTKHTYYLSYS